MRMSAVLSLVSTVVISQPDVCNYDDSGSILVAAGDL